MQAMKPVKVYSAPDKVQAGMLVEMLEGNGIQAYSQGEGSGAYMDLYAGFSIYGENIYVDEEDEEQARRLIEEVTGIVQETAEVPDSGEESRVVNVYARRKKGNRILAVLVLLLLGIGILWSVFHGQFNHTTLLSTSIASAEQMSDEKLYETIVEEVIEKLDADQEAVKDLKGAPRVFYVLDYFDLEVQNGGLCQFYTNASKRAAPYVSEALEAVGAEGYQKLYDSFNGNNGIDTRDLSWFAIQRLEEFGQRNARYPFEEFNSAYDALYEREPLNEMLIHYARKNLEDFY